MIWNFYWTIWVAGFAGILAIIGILQTMRVMEGEQVVPQRVWKWIVLLSAIWPLFAVLFIIVGLLALVLPPPKYMPKQVRQPFMEKKKFAFTVKVQGEDWDCYHFWSSDGKIGTLGFTKRGIQFVIGLMCAGHLSQEEATKKLEENHEKEAN